jgi:hypothetical protein
MMEAGEYKAARETRHRRTTTMWRLNFTRMAREVVSAGAGFLGAPADAGGDAVVGPARHVGHKQIEKVREEGLSAIPFAGGRDRS